MEPPPSIESVFSHKIAIFGHLEIWIGAWNWQKKLPHEEGFGVLGASFMNIRDHSNRKCD